MKQSTTNALRRNTTALVYLVAGGIIALTGSGILIATGFNKPLPWHTADYLLYAATFVLIVAGIGLAGTGTRRLRQSKQQS